jgi:hypothetical protein
MNAFLRRFFAVVAAAIALPAAATTHSTDYTDLWYLPTESGWGVNIVQQYDTVFATFFIYGSDNTPRWYVAPDTRSVASPAGQNTFTGPLFSTIGTYFGAPWGGPTQNTQVGSVSFAFSSPTSGAVSYTINGVSVTKALVRQTWKANVLTGNYIGGLTGNATNCRNGVTNGAILISGELAIGHNVPTSATFRVSFFNANQASGQCTFTGTYGQEGKMGRIDNGTFSCTVQGASNAPFGTFSLTQVEANTNGVTSRFVGRSQDCDWTGFFGGIKDVL